MSEIYMVKPPGKIESLVIRFMIVVGVLSVLNFLYFFFRPEFKGNSLLYIMLSILLIYGALKKFYLWYHYYNISVPKTPVLSKNPSVDVLTTFFPGEPYEMIIETLEAIQKITYQHTTYLCDEANDDFLKKECKRLGVIHVTRNNRIDAKAGNINNALKKATGKICLILDPDHIPKPNFLNVVLPHFEDEKIGYVQVVQAYYNKPHTLVARGASEQTFQFYGPMMMSMNSYGTASAIGANCTFRRSALDSIGGHAPGLAEDMHTAMLLHAKGWKSVYVPELVAKGLAPSDLASYYKQQLKWSRGVFELLYSVYPKQFKNYTLRQKIHYGLLPLHYLIGFIYLISFLIPIIALLFSKMPWTGDILSFALVSFPVLMSSLLIRTFIQKWVIEKEDRGFHIIGGLLQIITWWIFILGVIYTFVRKKVPYLPTPKSEEETNWKIVIPNLVIAALSIFAIFYGLYRDMTPFSLVMAFFASINTLFMFFSLYLASRVTNRNKILRTALERRTIERLKRVKEKFIGVADAIFTTMRYLALPLLILSVSTSIFAYYSLEKTKWDFPSSEIMVNKHSQYLGIFNPSKTDGISDLRAVRKFELDENVDFQIISSYIAWGDAAKNQITAEYLEQIKKMGASPMITWEPWANSYHTNDTLQVLTNKTGVFQLITDGYFDAYIKNAATEIKNSDTTVFLRFAHEFDNPAYPWSLSGQNTSAQFKKAWQYVHRTFEEMNVTNVKWVWNPWKPNNMQASYPGDYYVDWLGVTLLNYDELNDDGVNYAFDELYEPYRKEFGKFSKKPVMLAEFGSLNIGEKRDHWLQNAFKAIDSMYAEIKAVVLFNSKYDKNIPVNSSDYRKEYLDWALKDVKKFDSRFFRPFDDISSADDVLTSRDKLKMYRVLALKDDIRGVNYKKADNWFDNNYIASKDVLNHDFGMMRKIGINTIRYRHSTIYDYNVLKYAKANDINIIYSFDLPKNLDFVKDFERLDNLKKTIVKNIETLKDQKHILGWSLEGDVWLDFEYHDVPNVRAQRQAYLEWLQDLTSAMKEVDPNRPILKDIAVSRQAKAQITSIRRSGIKIDAFGLLLKNSSHRGEIFDFVGQEKIPICIGSADAIEIDVLSDKFIHAPIFLQNWQDQWETGDVTIDGLLDFKGRKKQAFVLIQKEWGKVETNFDDPKFRILRPAIPLLFDDVVGYSVTIFEKESWVYPKYNEDLRFEWYLARYDAFGNIVGKRKVGIGHTIDLRVPKNYESHRLLLTIATKEYSKTLETELNTPF